MARLLRDRRPRRSQGAIEEVILARLREAGRPMSAYDVTERAASAGVRIAPAQVYRSLARLVEHGSVYRIESLCAYLAVDTPIDLVAICRECHHIDLIPIPELKIEILARTLDEGFRAHRAVIEIFGLCGACQRLARSTS
jgi:Fur family zinc uptake transcriptional regulator